MIRPIIILLCCALFSCKQSTTEIIAEDHFIVDSFSVIYNSRMEISQASLIADTVLCSFERDAYCFTTYKVQDRIFKLQKRKILGGAKEPILAFFTDSAGRPNFITDYNIWYRIDTNDLLYTYDDSISLGLKYLQDRFRVFSIRNRPVLSIGPKIYFSPIWVGLEDYNAYLKEPCLVSVNSDGGNGDVHEEFFEKPAFFGSFVNPHISYCFNGKGIVLLYPNSDTLYTCDPGTGEYQKYALNNPSFSKAEIADTQHMWESDYGTRYTLHNFSYKAIWYNKNTGHYAIVYSIPADKSIKVPTNGDQPDRAVILDERFQPLRYLVFRKEYFGSNLLQTSKGLAMGVYSKHDRILQKDIPVKYYVYNF